MLRLPLLLGLTGLTGTTAAPTPKAAPVAPRAEAKAPAVNTQWLVRYGRFDAKQGSWSLTIPTREEKGC